MIRKIQKNLSENMVYYTLLAILSGIILGHFYNLKFLSKFIIAIVFLMIYPMMINLSLSSLKKIRGSIKPLFEAVILNFIYAPLLMWFLTSIFISDPRIRLALMLLSIAPASSMGLGYVGLAEGDMLSGAIIVAFTFIASIFVFPLLGHYFALGANLSIPLVLMIKNLLLILVFPLVLGIITRECIERKCEEGKFIRLKPYFSTTTLFFLYVLLFVIFASKSNLILKNYIDVFLLFPVAVVFYGVTILLTLLINKKILFFEYGQHQAVVFTSVSKNVALTIAILVSVFGEEGQYMAAFPAIISLFQALFLMTYLRFSDKIKKWFGK